MIISNNDWTIIAAISALGAFVIGVIIHLLKPLIQYLKDQRRKKYRQEKTEKIRQEKPQLELKILWGPPGPKAKNLDKVKLLADSIEFFYFLAKNISENKVYNVALNAKFPEGFEILKESDNRLKRENVGKTNEFIDELVGEGGKVSYKFLPSFGQQNPSPPQIRHGRRRAVTGGRIPRRKPNDVAMTPFWIETPGEGKYGVDVTWKVWELDHEVGEVRLSNVNRKIPIEIISKVGNKGEL